MAPVRGGRSLAGAPRRLVLALALLVSSRAVAEPVSAIRTLVVPPGARRTGDVVAIGRSLEIGGEVAGAAIATFGDIRVTGHVTGPVVVVGGDVTIAGGGRADGDILAVGGAVRFESPASAARSVGGRVRSLGALEAAFLSELETSPVAGAAVSPLLVSFRLFLLLLWLGASLALLRLRPRALGAAAAFVPGRLVLFGSVGTSAVLAGVLVSAGLLLLLPARLGLGLTLTVVALLFAAKLLGMAALFLAAGRWLLRGARRGGVLFGDPVALTAGLLALGLPSLVPVLGPFVWALASLVAIGLAARTVVLREAATGLANEATEAA
jgi:hypothetical protein